jgi:hypothetical protein
MEDEVIDSGVTEDEFDLAFNVAVGGEPEKEEPEKEDVVVEAEPEVAVVDEPAPLVEEKPKVEPEVKAAPQPEPAPKVDPEVERLAQETKAKEDAAAKAEADRLQVEALAREALTPEEQAALKEVEANFPDTASALKAVERIAFTKAENAFNAKLKAIEEKFEQKFSQISQDFAPAIATAKVVAQNTHQAEILKGHADAFEIVPKVEEWVNAQPDFLKSAYNAVLDKGSASQIVELFNIFKKETNGSVKGPPSSTPTPEETAQKAAKEKKLQSQEGVRSRQAAQKGGIDEDDFESAFNAAVNS